jgi:hypothetical protein
MEPYCANMVARRRRRPLGRDVHDLGAVDDVGDRAAHVGVVPGRDGRVDLQLACAGVGHGIGVVRVPRHDVGVLRPDRLECADRQVLCRVELVRGHELRAAFLAARFQEHDALRFGHVHEARPAPHQSSRGSRSRGSTPRFRRRRARCRWADRRRRWPGLGLGPDMLGHDQERAEGAHAEVFHDETRVRAVSVKRTVRSSIFSTLSTWPRSVATSRAVSSSFPSAMFTVKTTSSASKASPSDQVTPSRSVMVNSVRVLVRLEPVASHGSSSPCCS